jgi:hypothetical protein
VIRPKPEERRRMRWEWFGLRVKRMKTAKDRRDGIFRKVGGKFDQVGFLHFVSAWLLCVAAGL